MAEAVAQRRSNPVWLLPSAMTFVAFYKDLLEFGQLLADICRDWLDLCRVLWERLFAAVSPSLAQDVAGPSADMLTLWVTSSLAIWLFPLIAGQRGGQIKTTVEALVELRLPPFLARLVAFVLIGVSSAVIAAPFTLPPAGAEQDTLARALQSGQVLAPQDESPLAAWALIGAGIAALSYIFFFIGPRLAAAELSAREKFESALISILFWIVSAALLAAALISPNGVALFGGEIMQADIMVASLVALIGLVSWRSALPFVQLALLIAVVLTADAALRFLLDIWASARS